MQLQLERGNLLDSYFKLPIPTFRYVHGYFSGCKQVVDIGCSSGNYLELLPPNSIGLDVDFSLLLQCRARGLRIICADVDKPLPFQDASADGALASHILEHLRSPIAFLEELHRILRPQGILVIGLPVEGGVAGPWIKYFKGHRGAHGHLYSFSPDNLDELLTLSGFRIEKYFFHIAKIGYKKRLLALHDLMQHLPKGLLYKISSAYWAAAVRL